MLTCWQGDSHVVVDVDSGERRNVQVVVSGPAAFWLSSNYHQSTTPILNTKGEVIGNGWVNRGIFYPGDFDIAQTNARRLCGAVKRIACLISPLATSAYERSPGMIGNPGKCPTKNGSLMVTFLMATTRRLRSSSSTRSISNRG